MKKHYQLLLALILGASLGALLHNSQIHWLPGFVQNFIDPLGQIFLRCIFMVVVPLVFSGLVLGVYELSAHNGLAKVAKKTAFFTLLASTASVVVGISLVQIFKPGEHVSLSDLTTTDQSIAIEKVKSNAQAAKSLTQTIIEIVPKNPIAAAAQALDGEMISLMVFALIFAIALSSTLKRDNSTVIIDLLEQTYKACMTIVNKVMDFAPAALFCLIFSTSFKLGHQILISLAFYVGVVVLGLCIQNFGVYALLIKTFTKKSPYKFFYEIRDVLLYAFATASSNATLPRTLEAATNKLKLHPESSRFVLTVGSTANQNGTALFEGITVLFLAQVYNIDLSFAQQVQVVFMSILAGVGTAGVPGGSLPLIMILLQQVGIPPEGLGIIMGVDRFLDMCRTTVNVSGDLVIAQLVDESTKESS